MNYTELGLTKEQYEECIGLIIDKKINKTTDIDWQEICDKYNLPYCSDVLRKSQDTIFGGASVANYYMKKDLENIIIKENNESFNTSTNINKDGSYSSSRLLTMNEEQSKDVDYILKAHGFDS